MDKFSIAVIEQLGEDKQNISIPVFAKSIGLSPSYVYDILRGDSGKRWNTDTMAKACKFLGLTEKYELES